MEFRRLKRLIKVAKAVIDDLDCISKPEDYHRLMVYRIKLDAYEEALEECEIENKDIPNEKIL